MSNDIASQVVHYDDMEIMGQLNPFNKNNKLFTKNAVQNILRKYGIFTNINNLELYQLAMIHESYTIDHIKNVCLRDNVSIVENPDGCILLREKSYERLEIVGDAILDNIIVCYLFNRFPNEDEAFISSMKVNLVNRIILGRLSKHIGLDEYLIISRTYDKQGAREDSKILCDIFEAFLASIYFDFNNTQPGILANYMSGIGFQVAELFVINLIEDEASLVDITDFITNNGNYKDQLIKYYRRSNKSNTQLDFKVIYTKYLDEQTDIKNDIKSENMGRKEILVYIYNGESYKKIDKSDKSNGYKNGHTRYNGYNEYNESNKIVIGEGIGNTIKQAEQNASYNALQKLGIIK